MAGDGLHTDQPPANLTIALVGGGSGGHITPLLAVAEELKKQPYDVKLIYIGQTGDKLLDVPQQHASIDETFSIRAGKFRRYHGEGLKQLLDIKTFLKNLRDFFFVVIGIWQAFWLLGKIKPKVIFIRGGFVGVPVGLAAALRRIPYITHDSDAIASLANRIISRWATYHAVALPKKLYSYPQDKTETVGVPVNGRFMRVTKDQKATYRRELKLKPDQEVIFVSGGGNGAKRLNEAVIHSVVPLLKSRPQLVIIHGTGRDHAAETNQQYRQLLDSQEAKRVRAEGFFDDLYRQSGAADIVITRAGATSLAEFAIQQKCCIIVPNPQLTGGHQTKNARYMATQKAALVLEDETIAQEPSKLEETLLELLDNPSERLVLAKNLAEFAKPRAVKDLCQLLLETIESR